MGYTADQLKALKDKGHAMAPASPGGDPRYPINNADDLDNAIMAVGRGNGNHDTIRAYIIRRANALGLSSKIPDNWNSDGSTKDGS